MSDGINKVTLLGNLGNPPESGISQSGKSYARFSIATGKSWKDAKGTKQTVTEWHNIVAFERLADICAQYLKKGDKVYIEGELKTSTWDDATTQQKRYKTEIILSTLRMLSTPTDPQVNQQNHQQAAPQQPRPQAAPKAMPPAYTNPNGSTRSPYTPATPAVFDGFDDDIPF